jgi:hypothetical protein
MRTYLAKEISNNSHNSIKNTTLIKKAPSTPLQGCGALVSSFTRLLNHSVKIGHIPIYIGIE